MGVPAHDERDFAFAKKYGLPIKPVVVPRRRGPRRTSRARAEVGRRAGPVDHDRARWRHRFDGAGRRLDVWAEWHESFSEHGTCVHSGVYDGMDFETAVDAIARDLSRPRASARRRPPFACATGASAVSATGARRSRSSTAAKCGAVPVPEADLPVVLPEDLVPDGHRQPADEERGLPLSVHLPRSAASRPSARTDTMDTFVGLGPRYYMRYCSPDASRCEWSTRATTTGCRWTSTSAASSMRSCICCTRASGPR